MLIDSFFFEQTPHDILVCYTNKQTPHPEHRTIDYQFRMHLLLTSPLRVLCIVCILGIVLYIALVSKTPVFLTQRSANTHNRASVDGYANHSRSTTERPTNQSNSKHQCQQSRTHGWCVDRQGNGKCVLGFLNGPFDPSVHCANWWFGGMCLHGAHCRRADVVPPPSIARNTYHHPAPYYYRNMPWNIGNWCNGDRCYDEPTRDGAVCSSTDTEPVVITKVKTS